MKQFPKVLVIEDEADIAELMLINLKHGGFDPCIVTDVEQARYEIANGLPDVILLDWMLPGESGPSFAKKLRSDERTKSIPILLVTARTEEHDKVYGLDMGADDYIPKPFSPQELLARIRAVLRRRAPEHIKQVLVLGGLVLDADAAQVTVDGQVCRMGPTEFKLLSFLMTYKDRVHTRAHLLSKIWGDDSEVEERTVDVHIKRLREALGSAAIVIETVRGIGYKFNSRTDIKPVQN